MADAQESRDEDEAPAEPDLLPWRLTMKPPLAGVVYEVDRPVPVNPMLDPDVNKPLRGTVRRIRLISKPEGMPDAYRISVEPVDTAGKPVTNGWPDPDRPALKDGKPIKVRSRTGELVDACLDAYQVIEVPYPDVAEAVMVASKGWLDAHEDDLEDEDDDDEPPELKPEGVAPS